jgi:PAS domain S-box-containing protein
MHYTAMAAVSLTPTGHSLVGTGLDELTLALWVGTGTVLLLFLALISAMFDRRFEALALREAAAISAKEAHLREVLDRMPMAVVVVSHGDHQKVAFANSTATVLLGGSHPAQLPLLNLVGDPLGPPAHPFCLAIAEGREFAGELVRLQRDDGRICYLEVSASILPGTGQAEEVILTAQDVTVRIEAEQALQQNQKLETIGQLTGGVAHDFNNLLTPIIGGLDLLRRDKGLGERTQRTVNGALLAATKAATLVQRLLAFSRRQLLQPQPVDMGEILNGLRELIERSIGPAIKVKIEAAPDLVARVDPGQFELAILNLAVNARDAMPDGGGLTISAEADDLGEGNPTGLPAGRYICIAVTDTGGGMDEGTLRRAVEPFFSTKRPGHGTGLGLSMVHGLAAQSSGALQLRSGAGLGTSAMLWLPFSSEAPCNATPPESETLDVQEGAKILLVDDEELVRYATLQMLTEMGHDVVEASSGIQALSMLADDPAIEMVATDHLMPGMSGVELYRELRAAGCELPVVVITGYANPDELPAELPKLRKPFTASQLHDLIGDALNRHRSKVVDLSTRRKAKR